MKKVLALTLNQIKKSVSQKLFLVVMLLSPLLFTWLIGMALGGSGTAQGSARTPYYLVDKDRSEISALLAADLRQSTGFKPVPAGEEKAFQALDDRKVIAVAVIPAGFGAKLKENEDPVPLEFYSLEGRLESVAIKQDISDFLTRLKASVAAANVAETVFEPGENAGWQKVFARSREEWAEGSPVTIGERDIGEQEKESVPGFTQSSLGFTVMFVMFTLVLSVGGILEEREQRTWNRLLLTPTSRAQILGGFFLGSFVLGCIQLALLVLAGKFLFGVNWGSSVPGLLILMTAYMLAVMGLGTFLAGLVRTQRQLQALSTIVIISTSMLGGVYWPLEIASPVMQAAAKFTPQGWVMAGLTDLIYRGKDLASILLPAAVLAGMAAVFFVAGVVSVKLAR